MSLIDDEKLQQEYFVLVEHSNQLQRKILKVNQKRQELKYKMQLLTNSINVLEKEKTEKSWKITLLNIVTFGIFKYQKTKGINQQIKKLQIKTEKLQKKITKNKKVRYSIKNKKLKVTEKLVIFFKNLLTNKEVASSHNHGHVKQEEESILENKKHIEVTPTNWIPPVEAGSDEQVLVPNTKFSSRQNSKDSGFEGEQASTDEEDGIEVISSEPVEHDAVGMFSTYWDGEESVEFERKQVDSYDDDDIEVIPAPVEDVINPRIFLRQNNRESILSFERKLSSIIEEEGIGVMSESHEDDVVSYLSQVSSIWNSKDSGFEFEREQASIYEDDDIEVIPEPVEDDAVGAFFQDTEDSKDSGFEFEREQASIYEDDDIEVIPEPVEDDGIEVISEIDKIDIALKVSSRWDSKEGSSSFHESLEKSSTVLSKNSKSSDSDDVFANSCSSLYLNSLQWSLVSDCESSMLGIPSSL